MRTAAIVVFLLLSVAPAPAAADDFPLWKRTLAISDGRTFVTDGAMTIDAALAKPAALPKDALPEASAELVERYMSAAHPNEYGVAELAPTGDGKYRAPSGVLLNALYVDLLRSALPDDTLRLRMKGDLDPVVILSSGIVVGLVMPMKR